MKNGDPITIEAGKRELTLEVTSAELKKRKKAWKQPAPRYTRGVTYYLTGSMAGNYWGIPRTTHDLDFVVQLPMSAVARIVQEFSGDFYIEEAAVRAAYQPPHQFNAIDTRSALKVDFWLPKPEPFDQEMLRRRAQVTLFGEPVWLRIGNQSNSSMAH